MKQEKYHEIIELMRQHQLRNGFVSNVAGGIIETAQAYVLIELDINTSASINQLCAATNLDRNSVSRALGKLEKLKFISGQTNHKDGRRRNFTISTSGFAQLETLNSADREFLSKHLKQLNTEEIVSLTNYYNFLADSVGFSHIKIRKEEHPFIQPLRRLTRAFRFVGPNLFGSNYSAIDWHIFTIINQKSECTLSLLSETLGIHLASLSQRLDRYQSQKLLKKLESKADRRQKIIQLTQKGRDALGSIIEHGISLLDAAFANRPARDLDEFIRISRNYVLGDDLTLRSTFRPKIEFKEINPSTVNCAREFVLYQRARLSQFNFVPEKIIGIDSRCFCLTADSDYLAICEICTSDQQSLITNFVYSEEIEDNSALEEFLHSILLRFGKTTPDINLIIPKIWLSNFDSRLILLESYNDDYFRLKIAYH